MDWLADFQQSFRDPVFGLVQAYWPFLLLIGCGVAGWLFGAGVRRRGGSGDGGDFDADGGGDGGDGGGGGD